MSTSLKSPPEVQPALRITEATKCDGATNTENVGLHERPRGEVLEVLLAYDNLRDYIRYVAEEAQATKMWSKEEVQLRNIARDTHRSSHSQYWQKCTIKNKRLGPEEAGGLKGISVEETYAWIVTLLSIPLFIAYMIEMKTNPSVHYRYPEALLMYVCPVSLMGNACLYIRGRCFKFMEPNVEKAGREEYLHCVKENIQAWVQKKRKKNLGNEELEQTIMQHQESFAWYVVTAGSAPKFRGVEYSRRRNGALVLIIFWGHLVLSVNFHQLVYNWMKLEHPDKILWIVLGIVFGVIFVLFQLALHGTRYLSPGRLGRGWRMTELGMMIRENCYNGVDTENAETIEERFGWWIENLIRRPRTSMRRQQFSLWSIVSTTSFRKNGNVLMELESYLKTIIMRIQKQVDKDKYNLYILSTPSSTLSRSNCLAKLEEHLKSAT